MFWLISLLSGAAVGVTLGLVGGGGSILSVPLMMHVLGVSSPHVAIGTTAVAVTVNALANLALGARRTTIKWRCAALFALSGVAGAAAGAELGKRMNGDHLLLLFGVLMIVVGGLMFRPRASSGDPQVHLDGRSAPHLAPRLMGLGLATGAMSGFFGIGGGFLIVPALIVATGMPMLMAVSSSLIAVAAFGMTTAVSYAAAGLVDWALAGLFILGGVAGGLLGSRLALKISARKNLLARVFAVLVAAVGVYVSIASWRNLIGVAS
jgi:uncharacterized membrane protein YfcA